MTDKEFDEGLKGVMGDRFHDTTETTEIVKEHIAKRRVEKAVANDKNVPEKEKPVDAQWEPEKPTPNYLDKLKASAKDMALYVVLSMLLFWWQQSGRLDETTAWYSLLFCVGMVFFTIGRAWSGAVK